MSKDSTDSGKTIQEISLLYELSLSIGTSIKVKENCVEFLKTLMLRKNLGFVSVWIRDVFLLKRQDSDKVSLIYAHPEFKVKETHLSINSPLFEALRTGEVVSVSSSETAFQELVTESGMDRGVFTIFPLNEIGVLKLYSVSREKPFGKREINQLRSVVSKFAVSLAGCLSHDMLMREILERKKAENALRESEQRYRNLFSSARDAIFIMKDYRIVDCNPVTLTMFGCTREQIIGKSPYRFSPELQPDGTKSRISGERRAIEALKDIPQLFEWLHYRWDGTPFHAEVALNKVSIAGEDYLQSIVRDISDRRRAEEERLEFEKGVQHAQKLESLGVLAGGIAHDFNNLLVGILGNADLALRDISPSSSTHANILQIEKAAMRASDLSRQMLAYSGKGKFIIEILSLNDVVEEMAYLLKTSISKNIILSYKLAEKLPPIKADTSQISQIVMNLITNASEAIGEKSGIIRLSTGVMEFDGSGIPEEYILQETLKGTYAFIEVSDTGCGMSKETTASMFDPFYTTKFFGRGLGLAAVIGIVRGHRGAIKVSSELEKGSTILIVFPACTDSSDSAPEELRNDSKLSSEGTILLVDDDETVLSVGREMLETLGFSVLTAAGGQEAVDLLREKREQIVCVVLDLTMPNMDGKETYSRLMEIDPAIPVIISSGYSRKDVEKQFSESGISGFLSKPYRLSDLLDKLGSALNMENNSSD
ncbi:MAG: response regulator [Candidatus Aegiribacteria sp.]|nr:response regulator [Candidatus Aegiribacteria sp.]